MYNSLYQANTNLSNSKKKKKNLCTLTENKLMQKFQNCIEHLIEMLGNIHLSKYTKREERQQ